MTIETKFENLMTGLMFSEVTSGTSVALRVAFDDNDHQTPCIIAAVIESEERQYGQYAGSNARRNSSNYNLGGYLDVRTNYGDYSRAQHETLASGVRSALHCESILADLNTLASDLHLYDFQTAQTTRSAEDESERSTKFYFKAVVMDREMQ